MCHTDINLNIALLHPEGQGFCYGGIFDDYIKSLAAILNRYNQICNANEEVTILQY